MVDDINQQSKPCAVHRALQGRVSRTVSEVIGAQYWCSDTVIKMRARHVASNTLKLK
jgi:hypothetical protein